jgi:hypothetical protein
MEAVIGPQADIVALNPTEEMYALQIHMAALLPSRMFPEKDLEPAMASRMATRLPIARKKTTAHPAATPIRRRRDSRHTTGCRSGTRTLGRKATLSSREATLGEMNTTITLEAPTETLADRRKAMFAPEVVIPAAISRTAHRRSNRLG